MFLNDIKNFVIISKNKEFINKALEDKERFNTELNNYNQSKAIESSDNDQMSSANDSPNRRAKLAAQFSLNEKSPKRKSLKTKAETDGETSVS